MFVFQYYIVTTECIQCSTDPTTVQVYNTTLDKSLPCGNTYIFTVRAVISGESSNDKTAQVTLRPSAGAVGNLAVKFVPGKNETAWIRQRQDGFQLTWDPPSDVDPNKIEVGNLR